MTDCSNTANKKARYDKLRRVFFEPTETKFGLVDLFGRRSSSFPSTSWSTPRATGSPLSVSHAVASCPTGLLTSSFYSLRLEHREGGYLASHDGEERVLLFRSDRPGAVGKVVYSSQLVETAAADGKENRWISLRSEDPGRRNSTFVLQAKIHVVEIKEALRGYDLGSLLVTTAVQHLKQKIAAYVPPEQTSAILVHLDAEEDTRRHNKLLQFYQNLGFSAKPGAKALYLNNNDGETLRKISMERLIKCPVENSLSDLTTDTINFLPLSFYASDGRRCELLDHQMDRADWLIVDNHSGCVSFRTTKGTLLQLTRSGQVVSCKCADSSHDDGIYTMSSFKLLRMDCTGCFQYVGYREASQEEPFNSLWAFQSPLDTFLAVDPVHQSLFCSNNPILWVCDSANVRLVCTGDTPPVRRHYWQHLTRQTAEYVEAMKERYLSFSLRPLSLAQALDLTKQMSADPHRAHETVSLRTLSFRTAETVRCSGLPDWSQLLALVYHLGRLLSRLDPESIVDGYDWTLELETTVVGWPVPASAKCFRHRPEEDNECRDALDCKYERYCGLDNVLLAFTGPEYMYHMLRHNQVLLPDEGLAMLRFASLVDWHSRGAYHELASADDAVVQPFVVDFHELLQLAAWESQAQGELSDMDCEELWTEWYADLAMKYGMNGLLQW